MFVEFSPEDIGDMVEGLLQVTAQRTEKLRMLAASGFRVWARKQFKAEQESKYDEILAVENPQPKEIDEDQKKMNEKHSQMLIATRRQNFWLSIGIACFSSGGVVALKDLDNAMHNIRIPAVTTGVAAGIALRRMFQRLKIEESILKAAEEMPAKFFDGWLDIRQHAYDNPANKLFKPWIRGAFKGLEDKYTGKAHQFKTRNLAYTDTVNKAAQKASNDLELVHKSCHPNSISTNDLTDMNMSIDEFPFGSDPLDIRAVPLPKNASTFGFDINDIGLLYQAGNANRDRTSLGRSALAFSEITGQTDVHMELPTLPEPDLESDWQI